jgi:hypothetical protein
MAHFAQLDADNIVTQVIVVDNKEIADPHTGEEDEILGIAFCKKLLGGKWVQTSYNGGIRKRYAGIGYSYNATLDAFVAPKPFASWVLNNESADWEAPVAQPTLTKKQQDDGSFYTWDEETTSWKLETKTA